MIRTAELSELNRIQDLWTCLNEMHARMDLLIGKEESRKSWPERCDELIEKAGHLHLFELVDNGPVGGYCFSTIERKGVGEIDSVYISEELRGCGHGRQMMGNAVS